MRQKEGWNSWQYRTTAFCLCLVASIGSPAVAEEEVQVGRYATVRAAPTRDQADLLSAVVTATFPKSVTTVGRAVGYLLRTSGYRLAPDAVSDSSRAALLALPLPGPHRTLGPMPLQAALETLAGPSFRLVEDPVHRLVSFERCRATANNLAGMPSTEAR